MRSEDGMERREFIRVDCKVPIQYKFLSRIREYPEMDVVYEGQTQNISEGGMLLVGEIPVLEWTNEILSQKIIIGVNILLPNAELPFKVLTRVAWMENIEVSTRQTRFGLMFKEIASADKNRITQFIISAMLRD